ncbi:MAG TPA: cysteine desulfurase family protein [Acidimicrobiales bacterium]|nr:cysteine desulfurase family protein [Acidimicrobiales bacterium]
MKAYLDHAATTPLRPEARQAMLAWLGDCFGNPSGSHAVARAARAAVDDARAVVADCLGADPSEVVFTGGGTESDNLAVLGRAGRGRVLCSSIEHDAVIGPTRSVGGTVVPVDAGGVVDLGALGAALGPEVALVSVMLANNEIGVVQPLAEVVRLVCRTCPDAAVHTDAVQALSWLDVAGLAAGADLVSLSAHKFGGPQGVGVLLQRAGAGSPRGRRAPVLDPVLHGGGQERGRRSGTHNVAGIVGLAAAMRATVEERHATVERVTRLRDRMADGLLAAVAGAVETGERDSKVAGSCHLRFEGVDSEALVLLLDSMGICASAGSACASGATEPSHVLLALGLSDREAAGALRLSLGWSSTDADVDAALEAVPAAVSRLRRTAPVGS